MNKEDESLTKKPLFTDVGPFVVFWSVLLMFFAVSMCSRMM